MGLETHLPIHYRAWLQGAFPILDLSEASCIPQPVCSCDCSCLNMKAPFFQGLAHGSVVLRIVAKPWQKHHCALAASTHCGMCTVVHELARSWWTHRTCMSRQFTLCRSDW